MKKILIFILFLIPFLANAQDDVYLYGSTTKPTNNVIARNNFTVANTLYLGLKDTTFTPTRTGAMVTRPQDGRTYTFIANPGKQQWWAFGIGTQILNIVNGMHPRNDSTFGLGGRMDSLINISLANIYSFTFDSALAGTNKGFKVNFGNDSPWDLFTRDSITGYWTRIPAPSSAIGKFLQRVAGGFTWGAASGGAGGSSTNLTGVQNNTNYVVTNDNGTGFTIPIATQLLAGLYSSNDKKRNDSSVWVLNGPGTGFKLAVGSLGKDSLTIADILFNSPSNGNIIIDTSQSTLFSKIVGLSVDTAVSSRKIPTYGYLTRNYIPLALASGNLYIGNGSGIATPVVISGDFTISNAGVGAIGSGKVTNTMLAGSIAYSKLALTNQILNGDLAGSIAASKLIGTDITKVGTVATGTWNADLVTPQFGGTGIGAYGIGDILYASTATVLSKLPDVATGNVLLSGGLGVAPFYGKVNLGTMTSGNLAVTNLNSGTGATANTVWAGNGTWTTLASVYALVPNSANYTIPANTNFVRLSLLSSASRVVTLPTNPTLNQQIITIKNINTSTSFSWSFAGITVLDAFDNVVTTVPNGATIYLQWDGTNYNIIN
jgi:hypothetical protein